MERFAPFCAHFLLDAGKSGGGHGRKMDISFLKEIEVLRPIFLAGGLAPDMFDVQRSMFNSESGDSVQCFKKIFALDFNSGVEVRPGVKDKQKIAKAARAAKALELVQSLKGE
jgi:phosphoribosylanthranilate isomerase